MSLLGAKNLKCWPKTRYHSNISVSRVFYIVLRLQCHNDFPNRLSGGKQLMTWRQEMAPPSLSVTDHHHRTPLFFLKTTVIKTTTPKIHFRFLGSNSLMVSWIYTTKFNHNYIVVLRWMGFFYFTIRIVMKS